MSNLIQAQSIAVHDGIFHADDVFCVAMASIINPGIQIVRTRKPELLSQCDFIADVGLGEYDHHQKDAFKRPEGYKYSSCGHIWKDYGKSIIFNLICTLFKVVDSGTDIDEIINVIHTRIDNKIFKYIDLVDNGVEIYLKKSEKPQQSEVVGFGETPQSNPSLSKGGNIAALISCFNIQDIPGVEATANEMFLKAVNFAEKILTNAIIHEVRSELDILPKPVSLVEPYRILSAISDEFIDYHSGMKYLKNLLMEYQKENPDANINLLLQDDEEIDKFTDSIFNFLHYPLTDDDIKSYVKQPYSDDISMYSVNDLIKHLDINEVTSTLNNLILYKALKKNREVQDKPYIVAAYNEAISKDVRYMVLPEYYTWQGALSNLDPNHKILFVIFKRHDNDYGVQGVPEELGFMDCVAYHLEEWRAKSPEELAQLTGKDDVVFCHVSGFFLVTKSLESAIDLAQQSINNYESLH